MKKILKIIGIVILIFIVIGIFSGGSDNKSSNKKETKKEQPKEIKKEIVKVDTRSFIKEFDDNQLAAEKKYEGKIVELTAYIMNISETLGKPYLVLDTTPNGGESLTSINCKFNSKEELLNLKNGQRITVRGEFESQDFGVIGLVNCEIVAK